MNSTKYRIRHQVIDREVRILWMIEGIVLHLMSPHAQLQNTHNDNLNFYNKKVKGRDRIAKVTLAVSLLVITAIAEYVARAVTLSRAKSNESKPPKVAITNGLGIWASSDDRVADRRTR